MFENTKQLLSEWLDHSQRNSGYRCNQQHQEALNELNTAEEDLKDFSELKQMHGE